MIVLFVSIIYCVLFIVFKCQFVDNDKKNGLLWEQLNNIVDENAPATLSKLELPVTPLVTYIPDIIKEFR